MRDNQRGRQTLRHISRRLVQAPTFTATTLVTLGFGIGANWATFSCKNLLPIPQPDRLESISYNIDAGAVSYRDENTTFEGIGIPMELGARSKAI